MTKYEFRAVPCPQRAQRKPDMPKGLEGFCETLSGSINELAGEGWDYVRTEKIEVKERRLFRRKSAERTFLIFRREAKPLIDPRPVIDLAGDVERVRARRVKSKPLVEFVRAGGRKIEVAETPQQANADTQPLLLTTAAE